MTEQSQIKKLEILLIDDEATTRDLLDILIRSMGVNVTTAPNGEGGVKEYFSKFNAGSQYDIVLTDLNMELGNGIYVTREIKKISPQTPVYIMTGYIVDNVRGKIANSLPKELQPDEILQKPLDREYLKIIIDKLKDKYS